MEDIQRPKKEHLLTTRVDDETMELIRRVSASEDLPIATVIRRLIRFGLEVKCGKRK